jgi:hypothetical protein
LIVSVVFDSSFDRSFFHFVVVVLCRYRLPYHYLIVLFILLPSIHSLSMEQQLNELRTIVQAQQTHIQQMGQQLHTALNQQPRQNSNKGPKPTKPDLFNGHARVNADIWWFQFESYMNVCGIEDPDRVPFATTFFREAASSWWRAEQAKGMMRRVVNSAGEEQEVNIGMWAGFRPLFLARFRPLDAARQARSNLFGLRQTGSAQEYSNRFLRELQMIDGMDMASQVAVYIRGLKPALAVEIEKADLTELSDAMNLAARIDRITYSKDGGGMSRALYGTKVWSSGGGGQKAVPMELNAILEDASTDPDGMVSVNRESLTALFSRMNRNRGGGGRVSANRVPGLSKEEFDRLMKEGKCFRCKQTGHLARNCPTMHQHSAHSSSTQQSTNGQAQ